MNKLRNYLRIYLLIACLSSATNAKAQTTGNGNSLVEGEPDITEIIDNNNSPVDNFFQDIFETINPIIDQTKEVIAEINGGSLENAILSTLGSIGLIDPQEEANSISDSENSPYSNPQSPEEVARKAEAADAVQSQISDRLSQIVFGKKGQEAINEQNKIIGQTQETAAQATTATGGVYQSAKNIAIDNYSYLNNIAQEAANAESANASQDVLKAIAAQNQYSAEINAGLSEQLALLTESQIYNSVQMSGLNEQLTVSNQRQQNVETFLASQNSQLAEIDSNQELQIKQSIEKENQERLRSRQGMTRIFIPGLFEGNTVENNRDFDREPNNQLLITDNDENNLFQDLYAILNE